MAQPLDEDHQLLAEPSGGRRLPVRPSKHRDLGPLLCHPLERGPATPHQMSAGSNPTALCAVFPQYSRSTPAVLPQYYRSTTAVLQEYYRSTTTVLPE